MSTQFWMKRFNGIFSDKCRNNAVFIVQVAKKASTFRTDIDANRI